MDILQQLCGSEYVRHKDLQIARFWVQGCLDFGLSRYRILDFGFRIDERNVIDFIFNYQLSLNVP